MPAYTDIAMPPFVHIEEDQRYQHTEKTYKQNFRPINKHAYTQASFTLPKYKHLSCFSTYPVNYA